MSLSIRKTFTQCFIQMNNHAEKQRKGNPNLNLTKDKAPAYKFKATHKTLIKTCACKEDNSQT